MFHVVHFWKKKCKVVNGDQTEFVMIGQPTLPFFSSWTYIFLLAYKAESIATFAFCILG